MNLMDVYIVDENVNRLYVIGFCTGENQPQKGDMIEVKLVRNGNDVAVQKSEVVEVLEYGRRANVKRA